MNETFMFFKIVLLEYNQPIPVSFIFVEASLKPFYVIESYRRDNSLVEEREKKNERRKVLQYSVFFQNLKKGIGNQH